MPTRRDELDHVGEYNVMPGQEGSAPTVDSDAESAGDDVSYIDLVNEVLEAKAVGG